MSEYVFDFTRVDSFLDDIETKKSFIYSKLISNESINNSKYY